MRKTQFSRVVKCLLMIDYRVCILAIISLGIILIIGLDLKSLMLDVEVSQDSAKNINGIMLNLSYSIMAATIFYIIVNHVPYYQKWVIYNNIIADRLSRIQVSTMIYSYEATKGKYISEKQIKDVIKSLNPVEALNQERIKSPIGTFILDKKMEINKENMFKLINIQKRMQQEITEILKLDNYINSKLLKIIEIINSSKFLSMQNYYSLENDKYIISENDLKNFIESFCSVINLVNNIDIHKIRQI